MIGLVVIFLIIEAMVDTQEKVFFCIKLLMVSGLIFFLSGIFQRYLGFSPLPEITILGSGGVNVVTKGGSGEELVNYMTLYRSNALFFGIVATGCYTAQLLVIAIARLGNDTTKWFKNLCNINIIAGIPLLIFTYSRSAAVSFILGISCLIFLRKKRRVFYFTFLLLALLSFSLLGPISARFAETAQGGLNASTNEQHLLLWAFAVKMVMEKPLLGYGAGNFVSYVAERGPFAQIFGLGAWVNDGVQCHNIFLQTAAENGIFSAVALILFIFFLLRRLFIAYRVSNAQDRWIIIGLMSSVVVGISNNLMSNFFLREPFWVILGLASAASTVVIRKSTECPSSDT
jgi:O-antigen ligase